MLTMELGGLQRVSVMMDSMLTISFPTGTTCSRSVRLVLGRAVMLGNTNLGSSSPDQPTLHIWDPLSMTMHASLSLSSD